ncbi:TIGR03985 family CRISPR-associated protein [Picosynechococcus sp. NKBG042902]|uniref:TIGR03985 family CRISPR-associated protein n=1 Tax=Picosynechococcus sp. NKBG042902 TaxID=490193 RepID=UPI0004AA8A25|nr:TIGR03985 family CRISPR-associated protein [Picosynechococcus sp. NKBG042902]
MTLILPPNACVLQQLVPKASLAQVSSLNKAVRLWVLLDAIYRRPYALKLHDHDQSELDYETWLITQGLSFKEWYHCGLNHREWLTEVFRDAVPEAKDAKLIPLEAWLSLQPEFDRDAWIADFQAHTHLPPAAIAQRLETSYPYAVFHESRLQFLDTVSNGAEFEQHCQGQKRAFLIAALPEGYSIRVYNRNGKLLAAENIDAKHHHLLTTLKTTFQQGRALTEVVKIRLIQQIVEAFDLKESYQRLLRNDFKMLSELGLLKQKKADHRQRFLPLADLDKIKQRLNLHQPLRTAGQQILSLAIATEQLSDVTQKFLTPIRGIQRLFLDLDYVVDPEVGSDRVDALKLFLYNLWHQDKVSPLIQFQYSSASRGQKQILTYPIALYYSRRAFYLAAYGQTPQGKIIQHYNFRLDRIEQPQRMPWPKTNFPSTIPPELWDAYCQKQLPNEKTLQEAMELAWGFDIGLPAKPMLLRFERQFHDLYIHNSDRHLSFRQVSPKNLIETLENTYRDLDDPTQLSVENQQLIQERTTTYPQDAYYLAIFRVIENNIVMRLRAWGPKVEVIYPPELRKRLQEDIQSTLTMYE